MTQNSKRNEHPRCGCAACRHGAGTQAGADTHRDVNRRIRHRAKQQLKQLSEDVCTIVSTPYTD